ncbi:hypothetical protein [uncultured Maritimibacter sp.]|uniref:hypothetical protein n=1 Tax=uncultured Maritimibacter sp. TaxID=991866 RepID=UPI0030DB6D32
MSQLNIALAISGLAVVLIGMAGPRMDRPCPGGSHSAPPPSGDAADLRPDPARGARAL